MNDGNEMNSCLVVATGSWIERAQHSTGLVVQGISVNHGVSGLIRALMPPET